MSHLSTCSCERFHDSGSHHLCMLCLGFARAPQKVCDCHESEVAQDEQTCHGCGGINVTLQQGQHGGIEWTDRASREVRVIEMAGDLLDRAADASDAELAAGLMRKATLLIRAYRRSMPAVRPAPWTYDEAAEVAADEARIFSNDDIRKAA